MRRSTLRSPDRAWLVFQLLVIVITVVALYRPLPEGDLRNPWLTGTTANPLALIVMGYVIAFLLTRWAGWLIDLRHRIQRPRP